MKDKIPIEGKVTPHQSHRNFRPLFFGLAGTVAALAFFSIPSSFTIPPKAEAGPPHILYILIDTLRADHLGCYGYHRPTSPRMDSIAEQGILFSNSFSIANWTNPAIASLFTGRYPQGVFPPAHHNDAIQFAIPSKAKTLAEILKEAGYKTMALVAHPGINAKLGFSQGFDKYVMPPKPEGGPGKAWPPMEPGFVIKEFFEAIDQTKGQKHFFYIHLVYPHWPYSPPPPYDTMFGSGYQHLRKKEKEGAINQYDGEIRYTDDLIGHIFDGLKARRLLKKTLIVITADHGEAFWEHDFFEHGKTYYNEEIKVPLILYPPGGRTKEPPVIATPVSTIDLFPTILDLGGAGTHEAEGRSLSRFFSKGSSTEKKSFVFSESSHASDIEASAVIHNSLKFILGKQELLFDLEKDPRELKDLAIENQSALKHFRKLLQEHKEKNGLSRKELVVTTQTLDQETIDGLKALGYLD